MDIKLLKKGDVIRVVRNSREYRVLVPPSVAKSRDFLQKNTQSYFYRYKNKSSHG